MKPGQRMSPRPSTTSGRRAGRLGQLVAPSHELDRAAADADVALEWRRVAGIDGGAADQEVEVGHRDATLRRRGERAAEADGGEGHARADEGEHGAEAERAEQARHEDDAAEEADEPDRADRRG